MLHKADKTLVERLLKGEQKAFDGFYATFFPRVFRFCALRAPSDSVCQDLVQQTMTNAMRGLHNYRGEASLMTWLCQIARNEIATWYKRHGDKESATISFDHDLELRASVESIPAALEGNQEQDETLQMLVQSALDQLPTAYGDLLELKYIEGLSVSEIAIKLETGETAVQSLLARARKAFKQAFTGIQNQAGSIQSDNHWGARYER